MSINQGASSGEGRKAQQTLTLSNVLNNKKFISPRNGSTMKKIDRERQYTTERTPKH